MSKKRQKVATYTPEGNVILDRRNPMIHKCTDCGNEDDCRPYGKNGAWVCFDCAMKDEAEAARQFKKVLNGGLN